MNSRSPGLRAPLWLLALALVAGGCASLDTPGARTDSTPDPMQEIRDSVTARPAVPGEAEMLPNVELVSFPFQRGETTLRDTIRGASRVAEWLARLSEQTAASPAPFRLTQRGILICDGGVVEQGEYALGGRTPAPGLGSRSNRGAPQYLALWRPSGDDWKLARIYLSPAATVRATSLAEGCQPAPTAGPRIAVGGAFGTHVDPTGPAGRLWLRLSTRSSAFVSAEYDTGPWERTHMFAITGETALGPLWIAFGPAVVTGTGADSTAFVRKTTLEEFGGIGLLIRPQVRFRLTRSLRAVGGLGWGIFPDRIQKRTDRTLDAFLGIEWQP